MNLQIDPDVKAVLEFMQARIEASKLIPVARAVESISAVLWRDHMQTPIALMTLVPQISQSTHEQQLTASG